MWFARKVIGFLLGDPVSLFSMEVEFCGYMSFNLGRKQIQLESDLG
jgi:hypothetical protein